MSCTTKSVRFAKLCIVLYDIQFRILRLGHKFCLHLFILLLDSGHAIIGSCSSYRFGFWDSLMTVAKVIKPDNRRKILRSRLSTKMFKWNITIWSPIWLTAFNVGLIRIVFVQEWKWQKYSKNNLPRIEVSNTQVAVSFGYLRVSSSPTYIRFF